MVIQQQFNSALVENVQNNILTIFLFVNYCSFYFDCYKQSYQMISLLFNDNYIIFNKFK